MQKYCWFVLADVQCVGVKLFVVMNTQREITLTLHKDKDKVFPITYLHRCLNATEIVMVTYRHNVLA